MPDLISLQEWTPRSPDLTLLDYLVCDVLQEHVEHVYDRKLEPFANLKDLQNGIGDMARCRHQTARIRKAML